MTSRKAQRRVAVGVAVETHRLVLVDLTGLPNAGVERAARTRRRREPLALEASAHRLGVGAAGAFALGKAATQQVGVEFGEVGGARHGRRPTPLQVIDAILDARLLIALGRQTELRTQGVVAGQSRVARMQRSFSAPKEMDRHRLGVVPPQLARHAAEEGERLGQAVQDRLGPLGRHSQGERGVGVSPGDQEDRRLAHRPGNRRRRARSRPQPDAPEDDRGE